MRTCKRCGEIKPNADFYAAKGCRDGIRPECKKCTLTQQARRYRADPAPAIQKAAEWRRRNPERYRDLQRHYYQRHREVIRAKGAIYEPRWRLANPERRRANEAKRRAAKQATAIGPVDYLEIVKRNGLWCYLCDQAIATSELEFDHVVPLSKGGAHTQDNIRPTHGRCNRRKYNKSASPIDRAT